MDDEYKLSLAVRSLTALAQATPTDVRVCNGNDDDIVKAHLVVLNAHFGTSPFLLPAGGIVKVPITRARECAALKAIVNGAFYNAAIEFDEDDDDDDDVDDDGGDETTLLVTPRNCGVVVRLLRLLGARRVLAGVVALLLSSLKRLAMSDSVATELAAEARAELASESGGGASKKRWQRLLRHCDTQRRRADDAAKAVDVGMQVLEVTGDNAEPTTTTAKDMAAEMSAEAEEEEAEEEAAAAEADEDDDDDSDDGRFLRLPMLPLDDDDDDDEDDDEGAAETDEQRNGDGNDDDDDDEAADDATTTDGRVYLRAVLQYLTRELVDTTTSAMKQGGDDDDTVADDEEEAMVAETDGAPTTSAAKLSTRHIQRGLAIDTDLQSLMMGTIQQAKKKRKK